MVLNERWAVTAGGDEVGLAGGELRRGRGFGRVLGVELKWNWSGTQCNPSHQVAVSECASSSALKRQA